MHLLWNAGISEELCRNLTGKNVGFKKKKNAVQRRPEVKIERSEDLLSIIRSGNWKPQSAPQFTAQQNFHTQKCVGRGTLMSQIGPAQFSALYADRIVLGRIQLRVFSNV
jgi:hypothetical protein